MTLEQWFMLFLFSTFGAWIGAIFLAHETGAI